ncbi:EutN/CcmL family microcompartment protein [Loigolactobacillus jiayinensis]|uniref:EutN/CcmL family microcompartment protein n=1 Tax=Loigolactobacillus jiayinensis TaxID=2486016 RepID=A0ABW1RI85_9LACO|nr:EutN/CcmL family microcompartment protein [Loigolactobacillus jiayinensis]
MVIGKVIGNLWSTKKDEQLNGCKFLVVEVEDKQVNGQNITRRLIAIDKVGAGVSEEVLIAEGSAARMLDERHTLPVDAAILGIIDSVEINRG